MKTVSSLFLLMLLLGSAGCYRTVYHHLEPSPSLFSPSVARSARDTDSGWQHFFVYGWAPSERVIDAAAHCGGPGQVEEIRTQLSFAQGLVAALASAYINIYSPYTGQVVCVGDRRE